MDEKSQGAVEGNTTAKPEVAEGVAPVENTAPTEGVTPAEVVAPTEVATQATTGAAGKTEKKSKTGIIIGAIIGAVAVIGGGAYAYIHNTPEKVQYDAIAGFLSADHIQVEGTVKVLPDEEAGNGLNSLELELKEAAAGLNYDAEATIKANVENIGNVSVSLGGVFVEDGTIYIKVSNLKDALGEVLEATGVGYDYDTINEMTDGLIGEIDGQWWKISVDEVVDSLDDDLIDKATKNKVKKGWGCIMETAKSESGEKDKYAKIYKENSFVTTTKATGSLENHAGVSTTAFEKAGDIYDVKIDAEKLAGFLSETAKTANADKLFTCLEDAGVMTKSQVEDAKSSVAEGKVDVDEVKEIISEMPTVKIAISGWNHNLSGIYVDYKGDEGSATGALTIKYDKSKKVSAPSDAKSITELVEKAMGLVEAMSGVDIGSDVIVDYDDDDDLIVWDEDDCDGDIANCIGD